MLKLGRVTKVKVLFLVLVFVFNFDLFKFSAAILEKGLLPNLGKDIVSKYLNYFSTVVLAAQLGSLSKPRRRRQRERHQTKGLMSRIAVHVRYKSLYISLPSSAKQQREMTKFCVLYGTWTTTANVSYFHLELHAAIAHLGRARF